MAVKLGNLKDTFLAEESVKLVLVLAVVLVEVGQGLQLPSLPT